MSTVRRFSADCGRGRWVTQLSDNKQDIELRCNLRRFAIVIKADANQQVYVCKSSRKKTTCLIASNWLLRWRTLSRESIHGIPLSQQAPERRSPFDVRLVIAFSRCCTFSRSFTFSFMSLHEDNRTTFIWFADKLYKLNWKFLCNDFSASKDWSQPINWPSLGFIASISIVAGCDNGRRLFRLCP